jgi:hypothetical protein
LTYYFFCIFYNAGFGTSAVTQFTDKRNSFYFNTKLELRNPVKTELMENGHESDNASHASFFCYPVSLVAAKTDETGSVASHVTCLEGTYLQL